MVAISLVVYADAVKAEVEEGPFRQLIGWFQDEVEAVSAALENLIMQSAINPACRKVPNDLAIKAEYRKMLSGRQPKEFKRGTRAKASGTERLVVMRPSALAKRWIPQQPTLI